MNMRQSSWSQGRVTKLCASQQHWSVILCGVSVLGTFIATILLMFDSWVDALAVYIVSGLMLTVLVSRLAGQPAKLQPKIPPVDVHGLANRRPSLLFGRAPRI
jgi:hypothetical protein